MFDDADVPSWARGLNPAQLAAVTHDGEPLLIVAGAGTGKTRTLVRRVARLLDDGVDPARILLVTFTRRSAAEMLGRVAALGGEDARRVWGGTFHAVANRLLRVHAASAGLDPAFSVIDTADAADVLGMLRAEQGLDRSVRRFPRKDTALAIWSRLVNSGRPLDDVLAERFPWCAEHADALRDLFRAYVERKRAQRLLDYDDLLLHLRALAASPDAGVALRKAFDHVLVDEYQDTNPIQADIADLLATGGGLTVVGDDAQAVYAFRGATVANLWSFTTRHPGATTVVLEQNYRSTPQILAVANAVLAASDAHVPKTLRTDRPDGTRPTLGQCHDEADQARRVTERILELREEGVLLADQAVLFRAGNHSGHLELELTRRDVPFVKYGGLAYLETAHVKDLLAMVRLAENPLDRLAWHRVLGLFPGVGPARLRLLGEHLGFDSDPPPELVLERFFASDQWLPRGSTEVVDRFRGALRTATAVTPPPLAAQVERFVEVCAEVFPHRYDDTDIRLADLERLATEAAGAPSRERFLTDLVLDAPSKTSKRAGPPHLDDDVLTLSTIHSAKGCEWSAVHLIGATDGSLPADMALADPDGLEEERRLAYVALTRARDTLTVWHPMRYHVERHGRGDRHVYAPLSRFLDPVVGLFETDGAATPTLDDPAPEAVTASVTTTDEVDAYLDTLLT